MYYSIFFCSSRGKNAKLNCGMLLTQEEFDGSGEGTVSDRTRLGIRGHVAVTEEESGNESDNCK